MSVQLDLRYLEDLLLRLLQVHSPAGYTDPIVREVCLELEALGLPYELTRRGAIRATLKGAEPGPGKAIVTHVDTLGAMVKSLKKNGRLEVVPVGTWSSRFAEGARVSIFTDEKIFRGTILPNKASGHTYNTEIDTQPVSWRNVEIRVDEDCESRSALQELGFHVGDFVGVDSCPEVLPNGYINARHLDNKAGVAAKMAAAKYIVDHEVPLPVDCHLLFTISEEVGSGASAVLHGDISEMLTVDNGTQAPGQNSREDCLTVVMADSSGPFDYHLTHHMIALCRENLIPHVRDIFRYYRCDSASAVEAGNDIRTALVAFGVDASHGYERTNMKALVAVGRLLVAYAECPLLYDDQAEPLTDLKSFPETRKVEVEHMTREQQEAVAQIPPDVNLDDL